MLVPTTFFTLRHHETGAELDTVTSLKAAATRARSMAKAGVPVRVDEGTEPKRLYLPDHAAAAAGGCPHLIPCACGGWRYPRADRCRACWARSLKPAEK